MEKENKFLKVLSIIGLWFKNVFFAIGRWFKKKGIAIKDWAVHFALGFKPSVFKERRAAKKEAKKYKIKQPRGDTIFDILNVIIVISFLAVIIVPLLNLVALSFSDSGSVNGGLVTFLPMVDGEFGLSFDAFKYVLGYIDHNGNAVAQTFGDLFKTGSFLASVMNTFKITIIVTVASNLIMALCAYPLSKKDCPFKKPLMTFFIITMLFSAGLVPIYILMSGIVYEGQNVTIQFSPNLLGTIWPVILCSLCNVFNLLLFRTFYNGIPQELEESAIIDGAGSLTLFFKIIVPMSLPVLASCCFFTIVACINSYSGALLFIGDGVAGEAAQPMALYIYKLLIIGSGSSTNEYFAANEAAITSATIIFSIIPILLIYPFVIKYIKGGITLGSVKG